MKQIRFYTTATGRCPVQENLDELPDKAIQKVAWVLRVVRDLERVPANYFQKKKQQTPLSEIRLAEERKADYVRRRHGHG